MKFLAKSKDGGPDSTVWAYWLIEIKWLFSVVLLKFTPGTRPVYHSHAFNSLNWLLKGRLVERFWSLWRQVRLHTPSFLPVYTRREDIHQVEGHGTSWVLSFRGPWAKTWWEIDVGANSVELTHGRVAA